MVGGWLVSSLTWHQNIYTKKGPTTEGRAGQQSDLRPGKNGVLLTPTHVPMVGPPVLSLWRALKLLKIFKSSCGKIQTGSKKVDVSSSDSASVIDPTREGRERVVVKKLMSECGIVVKNDVNKVTKLKLFSRKRRRSSDAASGRPYILGGEMRINTFIYEAMGPRYGISLTRDIGDYKVELKLDSLLVTMTITREQTLLNYFDFVAQGIK
ncbi:unnamed protein product, partial [Dovyalis caffra]